MAIRKPTYSEKYPYVSPTTPGLYITFVAYIIELICLNVNKNIGPRFWSDKKYWGPKFRRELKGVYNVLKQLGATDALTQTAFVQIIREHNIKSLSYKTTVRRLVKNICGRKDKLEQQRAKLRNKPQQQVIDTQKNSTFVDTGKKSLLARIREAENG